MELRIEGDRIGSEESESTSRVRDPALTGFVRSRDT